MTLIFFLEHRLLLSVFFASFCFDMLFNCHFSDRSPMLDVPLLPSTPLLFLISDIWSPADLTTRSVINGSHWCVCLSLFLLVCDYRCTSKPPHWLSPSACRPPCPWGCSTCPRCTSSSSARIRTYPSVNGVSR